MTLATAIEGLVAHLGDRIAESEPVPLIACGLDALGDDPAQDAIRFALWRAAPAKAMRNSLHPQDASGLRRPTLAIDATFLAIATGPTPDRIALHTGSLLKTLLAYPLIAFTGQPEAARLLQQELSIADELALRGRVAAAGPIICLGLVPVFI